MTTQNSTRLVFFTPVAILVALCVYGSDKLGSSCQKLESSQTLAFPGAEGGGKYTTGGRGGMVLKVTNLKDSGQGSLREAIETPGTRTIIFEVSGTIELESPLAIEHGDLTIAGQSAPGHGICIKGHETRLFANNIIIRFIRFRPGDKSGNEYDALTGMRLKDIIIDHCSMSWSTDETVSFYDNENFTLQWCILSESLNNSVHRKGAHGYGGIWGGNNASFVYNILAHHNSRNPRLQGTRYSPAEGREKVELVNNIIYNWGEKAIYGGENGKYNIRTNIFIPGPATRPNVRFETIEPYKPFGKFFLKGNVFFEDAQAILPAGPETVFLSNAAKQNLISYNPFSILNEAIVYNANNAYNLLLEFAGASMYRDEVDQRVINDIVNRSYSFGNKGIIDSQEQTNGWPTLVSANPPIDSDADGIPDDWEILNGLDPNDPSDGNDFTLNPYYTNLEVYLNQLVKFTFPKIF